LYRPGFFVLLVQVKLKPFRLIPVLVALGAIGLVCLVQWLRPDFLESIEDHTYDMRAHEALKFHPAVAGNLGFVCIDEGSIDFVRTNQTLGYGFGLYWPRQVYGRLVSELAAQGAKAVAFDVIFGELRPDHPGVLMADDSVVKSDDFFARQMGRAGNVLLGITTDKPPPALFRTNALALGDIVTVTEKDGKLRRAKAFGLYRQWHRAFLQVEADPAYGVDLSQARIEPGRIVLPRSGGEDINVPLDGEGNFDLADFGGEKLPPGTARHAKPFSDARIWHLGIVLAAQELKLDLAKAEVDLRHGRITLRGRGGLKRVIPTDGEGCFYIDWCVPPEHRALTKQPIQELLVQERLREDGRTNELKNWWRGKLAVVGSRAVGHDLSDRGATPLGEDTWLVSQYWNVANSLITGRFVRRAPLALDLVVLVALGAVTAVVTWELRALLAFGLVVLMAAAYTALAVGVYVQTRYWLPIVAPVGGAIFTNHVCLLVWRVVFEQAERRRVKSIFSKMVSPKIVNELLAAETLSLGGARREITVFFADVRGFTELTDTSQERAASFVKQHNLTGAQAESCFAQQARETLNTVNLYLGLVADIIKAQDGTLDKFIGDCVMAFWGAPTPNSQHALACVRAAIQAQRAIWDLNRQRAEENARREVENQSRLAGGLPAQPLLPVLLLGSGINTGLATAGLMGSGSAQGESLNYTVFGREVNLASRLEGASGRGRIFISETTFEHLRRDDPGLAATCIESLERLKLKGFSSPVRFYEVPWRPPDAVEGGGSGVEGYGGGQEY
jgi:class 3 adenylate cyclase